MNAIKRIIDQILATQAENKRCNLYNDLNKQLPNLEVSELKSPPFQLSQDLSLKFTELIKKDADSNNETLKSAALVTLGHFLNLDLTVEMMEVLVDCLLTERDNQDVYDVVFEAMKNRLSTIMCSESCSIDGILGKNEQFPLVKRALVEAGKELPKDVCVKFLINIMPFMYTKLANPQRTKAVEIGSELVNFVNLTNLTPPDQDRVWVSIDDSYVKTIGELREANDPNWHKLWIFLVKFCDQKLHNRQPLSNHLLRIVEVAFRNSTSVEQRLHAYDCWNELIDNKRLNMEYMCSRKQITLLITPLKAKFSRTPVVIWKRFDTFVYLLEKLGDRATLCLREFLEFCFGPFAEHGGAKKMGQSNIVRDVQLLRTKVFMALIGHCHGDQKCLETLQKPVIDFENFSTFGPILVSSVMECCLAITEYKGVINKVSIMQCLWRSLLKFIQQTDDKTRNNCCPLVNNIMRAAMEKSDSESYRTILSAIIEVLMTDDIVDNLIEPVCSIILEVLCRTSADKCLFEPVKAFDFITLCLKLKKLSPTVTKSLSIFYNNDAEWINVNSLCRMWLEYNFLLSSDNYSLLIWPVRHLDKFEDMKAAKLKWCKVYGEQCNSESSKLAVLQEMEKTFLENPLLSSNITAMLEGISSTSNVSKSFVVNFMKVVKAVLTYPILKNDDLQKIISTILTHCEQNVSFYKLDNTDDAVAKVCACLKHIMVAHKNFSVLPKLHAFLATLQKKNLQKFSHHLLALFEDFLLNEDNAIVTDVRKMIELLDVKEDEQAAAKLPTPRSLRIVNMTGSTLRPVTPVNQGPPLRLFGKKIETLTPSPVRGSKLGKSPKNGSPPNRGRKIVAQSVNNSSIDDDKSSDYVKIDTEVKLVPEKLNEHQREVLRKRRDDIPALYQDLSQSQSRDLFSNTSRDIPETVEEAKPKVEAATGDVGGDAVAIPAAEPKIESTSSKTNFDVYEFTDDSVVRNGKNKRNIKSKSPRKVRRDVSSSVKATKDIMELLKPKLITKRHLQVGQADGEVGNRGEGALEGSINSSQSTELNLITTRSRILSLVEDEKNRIGVENNNLAKDTKVEGNTTHDSSLKESSYSEPKTDIKNDSATFDTTSSPNSSLSSSANNSSILDNPNNVKAKGSKRPRNLRNILTSKGKRREYRQMVTERAKAAKQKLFADNTEELKDTDIVRGKSEASPSLESVSGDANSCSYDVMLQEGEQHTKKLSQYFRYKEKLRNEILEARKNGTVVTRAPRLTRQILREIEAQEKRTDKNRTECTESREILNVKTEEGTSVADETASVTNSRKRRLSLKSNKDSPTYQPKKKSKKVLDESQNSDQGKDGKSSDEFVEAAPARPSLTAKRPRKQDLKGIIDRSCDGQEIDAKLDDINRPDDRNLPKRPSKNIDDASNTAEQNPEPMPAVRSSQRRRSKSIDDASFNAKMENSEVDVPSFDRSSRRRRSTSTTDKSRNLKVEKQLIEQIVLEKLEVATPSGGRLRTRRSKSIEGLAVDSSIEPLNFNLRKRSKSISESCQVETGSPKKLPSSDDFCQVASRAEAVEESAAKLTESDVATRTKLCRSKKSKSKRSSNSLNNDSLEVSSGSSKVTPEKPQAKVKGNRRSSKKCAGLDEGETSKHENFDKIGSSSPEVITILFGESPQGGKAETSNGTNTQRSSVAVALDFDFVSSDEVSSSKENSPSKRRSPDEILIEQYVEVHGAFTESEDVIESSQGLSPKTSARRITRSVTPTLANQTRCVTPTMANPTTVSEVKRLKPKPVVTSDSRTFCFIDLSAKTKTDSPDHSLTETETCTSEMKSLTPQIQLDLPKKPELTESEKEMCDMSTETLRSDCLSPVNEKGQNLAGSPINCETPDRTVEFLNNTLDISPINSASSGTTSETSNSREITVIPGARGSKLLRMANPNSIMSSNGKIEERVFSPINWLKRTERNVKKRKWRDENLEILTFSREIPSPLTRPGSSILKRKLNGFDDTSSPNPKRKRVNFSDPAISQKKIYIKSPNECQFYKEPIRRDKSGIDGDIKQDVLNLINRAITTGAGVLDLGKVFLGSLGRDVVKQVVKEFYASEDAPSSGEGDVNEEPNQFGFENEISPEIREDVNNLINRAIGMGATIEDLGKVFLESLDKDVAMLVIKGFDASEGQTSPNLTDESEVLQNIESATPSTDQDEDNDASGSLKEDVVNLIKRAMGLGVTDQDLSKLFLGSLDRNSVMPAIQQFCASEVEQSVDELEVGERIEITTSDSVEEDEKIEDRVVRLIRCFGDLKSDEFGTILAQLPVEELQTFTQNVTNALGEERIAKCFFTKEVLMKKISEIETDDLLEAAESLSVPERNKLCQKFLTFVTANFPSI